MKKITVLLILCICIAISLIACENEVGNAAQEHDTTVFSGKANEPERKDDNTDYSEQTVVESSDESTQNTVVESAIESVIESVTEPDVTPSDEPAISAADYENLHKVSVYASYEEFYDSFVNYDEDFLAEISKVENKYLSDTGANSYLTEDEINNGIFESFRNNIIQNDTLMLPFIDEKFVCETPVHDQCIKVYSANGSTRKPMISFSTEYSAVINTTYIDRALSEEAETKGGAWLASVVAPTMINIHNYEEQAAMYLQQGIDIKERTIVYAKEYSLKDRTVNSLVVENISDASNPRINIYFAYDDIFVCFYGKKDAVEEQIKNLSFYEAKLSSGQPLSDTPGRSTGISDIK